MFGWRKKNRNEEEQNADPAFRYQSELNQQKKKQEIPSPMDSNIVHTNQKISARPSGSIPYLSPTITSDNNKVQVKSQIELRQMEESTTRHTSMDNQREPVSRYKDISTSSLARLKKLDPTHPMVASQSRVSHRSQALDLKHNDNSFHVVAKLLVGRFEDQLSDKKVKSIRLTAGDLYHLNRVVPEKNSFIEAIRYRLRKCPENPSKPIHLITLQCHALGLDREGEYNLLYAPIGSNFPISEMKKSNPNLKTPLNRNIITNNEAVKNARPNTQYELARQQLTTELREASNLMAQSVTPEASQFWRSQVAELQVKLRTLHGEGIQPDTDINIPTTNFMPDIFEARTTRTVKNEEEKSGIPYSIMEEESVVSSLWQTIGYFPSKKNKHIPTADAIDKPIEKPTSPSRHSVIEGNELPIVDVVAPSDLPGGYQFEAELNNKRFLATVPVGGIRKGQTFYCYMEERNDDEIPIGRWRDGPFDCFRHGLKHPMLLNSIVCPLLALAQVMERVELDISGKKVIDTIPHRGLWSPRGMAISILCFWVFLNLTIAFGFKLKLHSYVSLSAEDILSIILVNASMLAFTIYATINTRTSLMERYHIPFGRLGSRIETVQSAILFPLTIAQMGRHTTSYDDYESVWCNATGIVEQQGP